MACNPRLALPAVEQDDKVGPLLSCNVLIQEREPEEVEITAVNLMEMTPESNNAHLQRIAGEVNLKLKSVFLSL